MSGMLWQRTDVEGHEAVRLEGRTLRGAASFRNGDDVCGLVYVINCDAEWRTLNAEVLGFVGGRNVSCDIRAKNGFWILNEEHVPGVDGCVDVDLNFSPSTNLLPIRRLNLKVGEEASVQAAWLRFPSFTLEPLEQTYTRTGERTYRYRSASFTAEIAVNEDGLVIEYGPWKAV